MKKDTSTSSYINDSSHKYLYKKIEKEIKDAFPCDNFNVLINYAQTFQIFKALGYLCWEWTSEAEAKNSQQMIEMWQILTRSDIKDLDCKTSVNNLSRFICALEGVSTNKILRKKLSYDNDQFIDENGHFFADDDGVKSLFRKFRYII